MLCSVLSSAITRFEKWCTELIHKVLRYLSAHMTCMLKFTRDGDLESFLLSADAGFAGCDMKSQSGFVAMWGGGPVCWKMLKRRASRKPFAND